jgi:putative hemolysin
MDTTIVGVLWRLSALLALVVANGFFVAAEFAIVTVRKTRVDQLLAEGHHGAGAVRRAVTAPDRYIAATQLGITMASVGLGWIGEPTLASMIQQVIAGLEGDVAAGTVHRVSVAAAFTIITAVSIIFGELVPKWIAIERSETVALWVVGPTEVLMRIFWPFIRVLHGSAQAVMKALGMRGVIRWRAHSEEELKMLVTASQEAGVLEASEEQMLHRVFGFADLSAGQVMIPRTELDAVEAETTASTLVDRIARSGHTRLPVYRRDLDHITGILHVTDLVKTMAADGSVQAGTLAREALMVPETLRADDLLAAMRVRGVREALVIDEYGGTAGLVTFEGLMERIVGDLGAFGTGAPRVAIRPDGSADIDGLTLVADVNDRFDLHIDEATFTTIGGYVLGRLGRRARIGDTIDVEGRLMRVDALDGLRVERVWLSRSERGEQGLNGE